MTIEEKENIINEEIKKNNADIKSRNKNIYNNIYQTTSRTHNESIHSKNGNNNKTIESMNTTIKKKKIVIQKNLKKN